MSDFLHNPTVGQLIERLQTFDQETPVTAVYEEVAEAEVRDVWFRRWQDPYGDGSWTESVVVWVETTEEILIPLDNGVFRFEIIN